jgi:hypothetical protein
MWRRGPDLEVRVVDGRHHGVDDLAQVVGRDVRRLADRDPGRAVDQQVGKREEDEGWCGGRRTSAVVDRVLVDVPQHPVANRERARCSTAAAANPRCQFPWPSTNG